MDLGDVGEGRRTAGADRPDRLIGDREVGRRRARRQRARKLARHHVERLAAHRARPASRRCRGWRRARRARGFALARTTASLSPCSARRSEWPRMTKRQPASCSIGALISPVCAPLSARRGNPGRPARCRCPRAPPRPRRARSRAGRRTRSQAAARPRRARTSSRTSASASAGARSSSSCRRTACACANRLITEIPSHGRGRPSRPTGSSGYEHCIGRGGGDGDLGDRRGAGRLAGGAAPGREGRGRRCCMDNAPQREALGRDRRSRSTRAPGRGRCAAPLGADRRRSAPTTSPRSSTPPPTRCSPRARSATPLPRSSSTSWAR